MKPLVSATLPQAQATATGPADASSPSPGGSAGLFSDALAQAATDIGASLAAPALPAEPVLADAAVPLPGAFAAQAPTIPRASFAGAVACLLAPASGPGVHAPEGDAVPATGPTLVPPQPAGPAASRAANAQPPVQPVTGIPPSQQPATAATHEALSAQAPAMDRDPRFAPPASKAGEEQPLTVSPATQPATRAAALLLPQETEPEPAEEISTPFVLPSWLAMMMPAQTPAPAPMLPAGFPVQAQGGQGEHAAGGPATAPDTTVTTSGWGKAAAAAAEPGRAAPTAFAQIAAQAQASRAGPQPVITTTDGPQVSATTTITSPAGERKPEALLNTLGGMNPTPAFQMPATLPAMEAAPAQHHASVASHPLSSAFAGDIAAEVNFLAKDGLQTAELHLNPVELGPIRIELTVSNQVADISFTAAHATTREGIEQSLPQLRELLSSQGMSLGHAGVAADSRQQQQAREREAEKSGTSRGSRNGGGNAAIAAQPILMRAPRGLLDIYA